MAKVKSTLLYGYYLGCPNDGGWEVEEAGFDGEFDPPWSAFDPEYPDVAMTLALLADASVPSETLEPFGWAEQAALLDVHFGVRVVTHGPSEAPRYSIACARSVYETREWHTRRIAFAVPEDADMILEAALDALGVQPLQTDPSWMLAVSQA